MEREDRPVNDSIRPLNPRRTDAGTGVTEHHGPRAVSAVRAIACRRQSAAVQPAPEPGPLMLWCVPWRRQIRCRDNLLTGLRSPMPDTASDRVRAYHQRSKHHFQRFAPGPGGLDWRNQPDPFRTFNGSPRLELPLLAPPPGPLYVDLYRPATIAAQPFNMANLAALLELAFGISAWKQYGESRWALRCNPSSGNLHPTEAYVVLPDGDGFAAGSYHYLSRDHVLEQRCRYPTKQDYASALPPGAFLVGLSSIHWREAWKYGERAYRYCQHDVGHAIAALRYAAAALGWRAQLLLEWADAEVGSVLGTDRDTDFVGAEREHPDLMLLVQTQPHTPLSGVLAELLLQAAATGDWLGTANALSPGHSHHWPIIDQVAAACAKPRTEELCWQAPPLPAAFDSDCDASAATIIKQRRSAQALDSITSIPAQTLYRLLDLTLPRGIAPFDVITWRPRLHLLLFVHRVDGLAPGLYWFLRRARDESELRANCSPEFEWTPVHDCPSHFHLYRLATGDMRDAARILSCQQDIAADGAFSLGMLAEYAGSLAAGPWVYPQLFWEAGVIGQVLYLEAEAAGIRGTGIGCYFDDGVHEILGLENQTLQSMYHFTAGGPLIDARLQTLPPYAHLNRT